MGAEAAAVRYLGSLRSIAYQVEVGEGLDAGKGADVSLCDGARSEVGVEDFRAGSAMSASPSSATLRDRNSVCAMPPTCRHPSAPARPSCH
jgi:hypothetical protein